MRFYTKLTGLLLPAFLLVTVAKAQKLPNIQKGPLRAPSKIKIDGKLTEWGKLQAYNHAIQASYTVSNDNEKIYLAVQSNRKDVINKIIKGGISFTINKIKKKAASGITITYPSYNMFGRPVVNLNTMFDTEPGKKLDSLVDFANLEVNDKAKFISINGVQDVDTLISVYNTDGIKVASRFGNNKTYTVEMSVNLKLFGLSAADATKFNYQIRFNEIKIDYVPGVIITRNEAGTVTEMNVTDAKLANSFISALSTTDLWGEYTLAK